MWASDRFIDLSLNHALTHALDRSLLNVNTYWFFLVTSRLDVSRRSEKKNSKEKKKKGRRVILAVTRVFPISYAGVVFISVYRFKE